MSSESKLATQFEFVSQRPLGTGGFGKVFHVKKRNDKEYALKYFGLLSGETERETEVLQKLQYHPNVVRYFESWEENQWCSEWNQFITPGPEKYVFIIMELCSGGDLRQYLNDNTNPNSHLEERNLIFEQIINGLIHLHAKKPSGIIHRDLKPENIFLQRSESKGGVTNVKIGDFGFSRELRISNMTSKPGSPYYRAPEIRSHGQRRYDLSIDIYSVGKIYYELYSGICIKKFEEWEEEMTRIEQDFNNFNQTFSQWPDKVFLLKSIIAKDPKKRRTALEISHFLHSRDYLKDNESEFGRIDANVVRVIIQKCSIDCEELTKKLNAAVQLETIELINVKCDATKFSRVELPSLKKFHFIRTKTEPNMDFQDLLGKALFFLNGISSSNEDCFSQILKSQVTDVLIGDEYLIYFKWNLWETELLTAIPNFDVLLFLTKYQNSSVEALNLKKISLGNFDVECSRIPESLQVLNIREIVNSNLSVLFQEISSLSNLVELHIDDDNHWKSFDFGVLPLSLKTIFIGFASVYNSKNGDDCKKRTFESLSFENCSIVGDNFFSNVSAKHIFFFCADSHRIYQATRTIYRAKLQHINFLLELGCQISEEGNEPCPLESICYEELELSTSSRVGASIFGPNFPIFLRFVWNRFHPVHSHSDLQVIMNQEGKSTDNKNVRLEKNPRNSGPAWSVQILTNKEMEDLRFKKSGHWNFRP